MVCIALINQKGGVSKTTIATNLARAAELRGRMPLLIDSDEQESATDWNATAEGSTIPLVQIVKATSLESQIKNIRSKDFVVIDCAGELEKITVSAIRSADLILIPVKTSGADLWASQKAVELIKARLQINPALKAAFVITQAIKGTRILGKMQKVLPELGLPVLKTIIYQRVGYMEAFSEGETVFDRSDYKDAADEIFSLYDELIQTYHI